MTNKMPTVKIIRFGFWLVLFAFIVGRSFLLEKIATKALYDFDEARYAEVAKNIIKTGDWLIPMAGGPDEPRDLPIYTLPNGEPLYPYFWKPPLATQVMALSMRMLGINELAVRLPSLLATLVSVWLVFKITDRLFPKSKYVPYVATILFVSSSDLSFLSSQGLVEIPMLALALTAVFWATQKTNRSIMMSGIFFGLAFLTKSFITYWIPVICLMITWQGFNQRTLKFWSIFIISGLVTILPWHMYMYFKFGSIFIDRYVLVNILGRVDGATGNQAPTKWYFIYMLDQWKPYIFALPTLISLLWQDMVEKRKAFWLLCVWIGLIILPLSLASSKVYWYIFPIIIPISILLSIGLESAYHQKRYLVLLLTLVASLFSMHPFWQLNLRHTPIKEFTIFFVLAGGLSFILGQKTKKRIWYLLMINLILICGLGFKHNYKTALARQDDNAPIKHVLVSNRPYSGLAVLDMAYEAPLFYADSGHVEIGLQTTTQFILTKKSDVAPDWINQFNLIKQEKEIQLYQRK